MANDGHVLLDATGRRMMRDDGSLDICEECCVNPCEFCGGNTPGSLVMLISECALCCAPFYYENVSAKFTNGPSKGPNGTYILQQSPSAPCGYSCEEDCSGTITIYDDYVCGGNVVDSYTVDRIGISFAFGYFPPPHGNGLFATFFGYYKNLLTEEGAVFFEGRTDLATCLYGTAPQRCSCSLDISEFASPGVGYATFSG